MNIKALEMLNVHAMAAELSELAQCTYRCVEICQQVVRQGCELSSRVAPSGRGDRHQSPLRAQWHRAHTTC